MIMLGQQQNSQQRGKFYMNFSKSAECHFKHSEHPHVAI